jgi:transposase
MSKFNAKAVAAFIASQTYTQFDYQVRGKVAAHFGVTTVTAARWVSRVVESGMIRRSGRAAVCLA